MVPTIVMLHALGGDASSWRQVIARLGGIDCLPLDLPGFGAASDDARVTVEAMADVVADAIRARAPARWIIVGHSMGGKVATVVASRAERGVGPDGLAGVMLFAGSPPSPEPMDEKRRAAMIGWVADGAIGEEDARQFVTDNTATPLPPPLFETAVAAVRASDPGAWRAWLERGAREDWARAVGELAVPAVIVAGGEDGDLAAPAQCRLNLPHYPGAQVHVVEGAAHLLPLEAPDAVAALIRAHAMRVAMPLVPDDYGALLASDRVSARTRALLTERGAADDDDYRPKTMDKDQLAMLRLLVVRIIPDARIDLAARIDAQLAAGEGDGWRFAALPDDAAAYRAGLDTLAALGFGDADVQQQDEMLRSIADGSAGDGALTAAQMTAWFEDVRAAAVRLWVAHPATMAAIGYDGIANGGDGLRKQGYQRTAADTREAWEPVA